jgi:hypothetical protein
MQSMKDNSKIKMNNIVQLGCLISKLLRLFVDFPSAIVGIFYGELPTQCCAYDAFKKIKITILLKFRLK